MNNLYELIQKADNGDTEAKYKAAIHILYQMSAAENDIGTIDRAIGFLRDAAAQGYSMGEAAMELGNLYYHGKYIVQDYNRAVMWYRTACQKRHPFGFYCLGNCYYYGNGVIQNFAKAFDCFFKGGLTGCIDSYYRLGDMYKNGEFANRDLRFSLKLYEYVYDDEIKLYEKIRGYSDAFGAVCLRLGECYLYGIGVNRDIAKANKYFSEAKDEVVQAFKVDAKNSSLLQLMNDAPYPETTNENNNEASDDEYVTQTDIVDKKITQTPLDAYCYLVKNLLIAPKSNGGIYKKLSAAYSNLSCFEQDQVFIDFCLEKAEKILTDGNKKSGESV